MKTRIRFTIVSAICLVVGASLFTVSAFGDSATSTRNRIRIKKTSQLQPSASPDDAEQYSVEKMELLNQKRRALILDIKRFLREARDAEQKSELNLRLGGLYMEDYHANLAKAQIAFEKESAKLPKGAKKNVKFDNSEAMASLDKARAIYKDLLGRYPRHPRRDEMYYFLAVASLDKSKLDEGMAYFKKLSEDTPNSKYMSDSLVQLGDYYFDSNKFPQAEVYFDKIINKKAPTLVPYATYKKAWCEYNLGRPLVALNLFKWVINNDGEEGSNSIRIKGEALKDITLPFVDLKLVNDSIAFFRAAGDPYTRHGMETMAALYFEAGDYKNAIVMNQTLLAMDPNHVKNPSYDVSIIESYKLQHQEDPAINRLFTVLPNYMINSSWYEINSSNSKAISEAATEFEDLAWKYGTDYHAQAQRTKNEQLYNMAKSLYGKYLEFFPHSVRATKVRFELAEILYKQSQYIAAADNYYAVYKDPQGGQLKLQSIQNGLMSLDRELNLERKKLGLDEISSRTNSKLKDAEDANLAVQEYSDVEVKFLSMAEEYLSAYPNAKNGADIVYESAYLQYLHHDFAKAYKNFWNIVKVFPKHETAYTSAHLILDILNRKKDYDKMIEASKKFLDTPELSHADFRADISDILRHSVLKKIQVIEDKQNYKEAAEAYIEYTKEYGPEDLSLFEKALYNASVDYTKANNYPRAVDAQEQFLRRFPKSALREKMFLQVAKTYELFANFDKAAYYYDQFSSLYPSNPQAKNALRLAGLYYWGSGNPEKAESTMLTYLGKHPDDRKLIEKDILDLYESEGATNKLVNYYLKARAERGCPASDYVAYSLKIAEIQSARTGKMPTQVMEEALKASQHFAKQMTETPKGAEALAKLRFWYSNLRENAFYGIKLELPQRQLEVNLQRKLAMLKEIEKDYASVASLGGEWGLGAMYKTAVAYHRLASDIQQAPVPPELSAEQVDMYREQINKAFIKPFSEKAMSMAATCLDRAQELGVLSVWTPRCYSLASELDSNRYPVVRTFYLPPLELALMIPENNESKIQVGSIKQYAYPFFSFGLFSPGDSRSVASLGEGSGFYSDGRSSSDGVLAAIPTSLNYKILSDERKIILNDALNAAKPSDTHQGYSLAYLNLLRLVNPNRALPLVLETLQKDPQNESLHNLLGLTYLQLGNNAAAKVTWLSMVAQGTKNASLWNNLGVLAFMQGREAVALEYFNEAIAMTSPREALDNLGFISLKYRNGFGAKKHFEEALALEKSSVISQVGYATALLQNREMDAAKERLVDLSRKYKTDPYARLSLGYYLIDVEKENELASKVLGEYVDQQALDNDIQFRQALQEARHQRGQGEELPAIGGP